MGLDKLRYQVDKLRQEVERATGVIRVSQPDGSTLKFTPGDAQRALLNGVAQITEGAEPDSFNRAVANSPEAAFNEHRFFGVNTVIGDVEDLSEQAPREED